MILSTFKYHILINLKAFKNQFINFYIWIGYNRVSFSKNIVIFIKTNSKLTVPIMVSKLLFGI
jgi:hypothetical protein